MVDEKILKTIGYNIQKARNKKNLTQEKLAEKCNVSPNYISDLERGKSAGSISLIINICNCLDVTPNYIFDKAIKSLNNNVNVLPNETAVTYLSLKKENQKFVKDTIEHLYFMQKKR